MFDLSVYENKNLMKLFHEMGIIGYATIIINFVNRYTRSERNKESIDKKVQLTEERKLARAAVKEMKSSVELVLNDAAIPIEFKQIVKKIKKIIWEKQPRSIVADVKVLNKLRKVNNEFDWLICLVKRDGNER